MCFVSFGSYAQKIATLEIKLPHSSSRLVVPVHVDISDVASLAKEDFTLVLNAGGKVKSVPFQVATEEGKRVLYWNVETTAGDEIVKYDIIRNKKSASGQLVEVTKSTEALTVRAGNQNLLQYNFKVAEPPSGVDPSYGRSGFIHPLWSPKGQVLTRIQPPDHYHHYGIWNPWTHVLFEGDTLDFWNLNKKEATVRFAKFLTSQSGSVFGEYSALHEHVVLKGKERVALNEVQSIRVYQPETRDYYVLDITIDMQCATSSPFLILAYRYAGLGWRTTEKWDNKNSEVLSSEGKTRKDADGTTARWCLVQGAIDNDYAGALMMSYPMNYNHPEPLRIWPENQYGRGDMFANFSPTKNKDWLLNPGEEYRLRYRFIVFNGKWDREKSETAWQYFVNPPEVKLTLAK